MKRVGISLVGLDRRTEDALKVLTVQMNRLQDHLEFEFLECDKGDPFIQKLRPDATVDLRNDPEPRWEMTLFIERHQNYLSQLSHSFRLKEEPPDWFILVTTAHDLQNFYSRRMDPLSVLLLGDWSHYCAPPSVVEFILAVFLREGAAALSEKQSYSVHLGSKGCLFDFSRELRDARLKTVNSFVCQFCRQRLAEDGVPGLADELERVLDFSWFGKSSDPASPAGLVSNIGYDLFRSKGLKPTLRDRFVASLQDEGVKAIYALLVPILLAVLFLILGLKAVSS